VLKKLCDHSQIEDCVFNLISKSNFLM